MHSRLFGEPAEWGRGAAVARGALVRYAQEIGIDSAWLGRCVDEGRYSGEVRQDFEEALSLGLTGTPAFIINGKLLSGAQPAELFFQLLDRELTK